MSFVDTFENAILDAMLGAGATLLANMVEVGLSTTTPTDAGGNITEPSGHGYTRVLVPNNAYGWNAASGGIKTNASDIVFPENASVGWGVITHWVIFSSGSPKIWGVIDDGDETPTPLTIAVGDRVRFLPNALRITLD